MDKEFTYQSSKIFYRVEGTGQTLFLIHGFAEDHSIWEYQVSALKKDFQLIIPDLPGSGKSPYHPGFSSLEDFADCIRVIAEREQRAGFALVGHSMGGYVTLAFGEKYPDRLSGIGLFHSTAFPDTEEKKSARRKSIEFINQHGSAPFIRQSVRNLFSDPFKKKFPDEVSEIVERFSQFDPRSLVRYYETMIIRPDRTRVLQNFHGPVLFIIGEQDKAVPLEDSLHQCHLPLRAHIHILEDAAHMGMLEDPAGSTEKLADFMKALY